MDPSSHSPSPVPPAGPAESSENPQNTRRRARGKIARLKPAIREKINQLIDEGITYEQITKDLEPDVPNLKEMDISRWYKSGHQDWQRNQLWLENTRSRLDMALDVISEHDGSSVHLANLHVAATQLINDLIERGQTLLTDHTDQYVEIIHSISRLSHEALNHQKYSEACTRARNELAKLKDTTRKLSDAETLAIVDTVDRILGFK